VDNVLAQSHTSYLAVDKSY